MSPEEQKYAEELKEARKRLTPGTAVIMNDVDCPAGFLVAVITRWDPKDKVFRARYLSERANMIFCYGAGHLGFPTPIEDFGVTLDWSDDGSYRAVPTGEDCVAKYRDGDDRKWGEQHGVWCTPRPLALKRLDDRYKRKVDE